MCWSITAPRYLTDVVEEIDVVLQVILRLDCAFNFGLEPNTIDAVLPKCKESLLSINHWLTDSKSSDKVLAVI